MALDMVHNSHQVLCPTMAVYFSCPSCVVKATASWRPEMSQSKSKNPPLLLPVAVEGIWLERPTERQYPGQPEQHLEQK